MVRNMTYFMCQKLKNNVQHKNLIIGGIVTSYIHVTACSNEDETVDTHATTMQVALTPEEVLNITYNGITYKNVPIAYDSNGDLIFLDNAFSKIYQHDLANNPLGL